MRQIWKGIVFAMCLIACAVCMIRLAVDPGLANLLFTALFAN